MSRRTEILYELMLYLRGLGIQSIMEKPLVDCLWTEYAKGQNDYMSDVEVLNVIHQEIVKGNIRTVPFNGTFDYALTEQGMENAINQQANREHYADDHPEVLFTLLCARPS